MVPMVPMSILILKAGAIDDEDYDNNDGCYRW